MPTVPTTAPKKPPTRYPTKVDAFIAIGPGVLSAIATISSISSSSTHFLLTTVSL